MHHAPMTAPKGYRRAPSMVQIADIVMAGLDEGKHRIVIQTELQMVRGVQFDSDAVLAYAQDIRSDRAAG